jgi:hypothetical protein
MVGDLQWRRDMTVGVATERGHIAGGVQGR